MIKYCWFVIIEVVWGLLVNSDIVLKILFFSILFILIFCINMLVWFLIIEKMVLEVVFFLMMVLFGE